MLTSLHYRHALDNPILLTLALLLEADDSILPSRTLLIPTSKLHDETVLYGSYIMGFS